MKIKFILFLMIFGSVSGSKLFGQCTQPGLKIESQDCAVPKNLVVRSISCTEMNVRWTGNKNQNYILKASCTDPVSKVVTEENISRVTCDEGGNCSATIFVKESTITSWSIESVCTIESATFHSSEVKGPDTYIPFCPETKAIPNDTASFASKDIRVFPNPSTGYLIVEFSKNTEKNIQFKIFDTGGKQVFNKTEPANLHYKLDLKNIVNGVYLLEVNTGKNLSVVKFELLRK